LVVALLLMVLSPLAFAVAFHAMRGMYLHAERLLAKVGGSKCKPRGIPTWSKAEGAAQRRSAQAKRGRLGSGLQARGAKLPLAAFACSTRRGVAGRVDLPAEEGGGRRTAAEDREEWKILPPGFVPRLRMATGVR
jgi:hypothetical protein